MNEDEILPLNISLGNLEKVVKLQAPSQNPSELDLRKRDGIEHG
jgi:hypothetical protein